MLPFKGIIFQSKSFISVLFNGIITCICCDFTFSIDSDPFNHADSINNKALVASSIDLSFVNIFHY